MTDLLLDTCAMLWVGSGEKISGPAQNAINQQLEKNGAVYVSPFSSWEIGNLVSRGRLNLSQSPEKWFKKFLQNGGVKLAELSSDILVNSNFLPAKPPNDPADRIIIATAREFGLTLMTRDRKILNYAAEGHVNALQC